MKNLILLIICLLTISATAQTNGPLGPGDTCNIKGCQTFQSMDLRMIYQAIKLIGKTSRTTIVGTSTFVSSGTSTVAVTGSVTTTPGITARTITSSSATTTQTIAAGTKAISIETSSDYVGNIDGIAGNASSVYPFSADDFGTLPQIIVTVSAGSVRIRKIQ